MYGQYVVQEPILFVVIQSVQKWLFVSTFKGLVWTLSWKQENYVAQCMAVDVQHIGTEKSVNEILTS